MYNTYNHNGLVRNHMTVNKTGWYERAPVSMRSVQLVVLGDVVVNQPKDNIDM